MYDLADFKLSDAASCSMALRKTGFNADSMEDVAKTATRFLYENMLDKRAGTRACALVRIFKTHSFDALGKDLKSRIETSQDRHITYFPGMRCMVLLATAGDLPEWNDRIQSKNHQAIPLPSPEIVGKMPMISQLLKQLNFNLTTITKPSSSLFLDPEESNFGVFFIPEAQDSPHIPDQETFVRKHKVQSVFGFGAMLPSNNMFAAVLFSKVPISRESANFFKTFALSLKVALVPFDGLNLFNESREGRR